MVLNIPATQIATMDLRCAIDHSSILRVVPVEKAEESRVLRGQCCGACLRRGGILMKRELSIGVMVKDTSSETAIANEAVNPKDDMKRPTMPPMNPMGRNTAISDSVVAITARPISRVPSIAACERAAAPSPP